MVQLLFFKQGLISVEDEAFRSCDHLTKVEFGDKLERIGNEAFRGCFNLELVVTGMGLREIGSNMLEDTRSVTIVLPDNIEFEGTNNNKVVSLNDRLRDEQSKLPAQIEELRTKLDEKQNRLDAINEYLGVTSGIASVFGGGTSWTITIGCSCLLVGVFGGILIGKKASVRKHSDNEKSN